MTDALLDPGPNLSDCLNHSPVAIGLFDPQERLRYSNLGSRDAYAIEPGEHPTWEALMRRRHRERRGRTFAYCNYKLLVIKSW